MTLGVEAKVPTVTRETGGGGGTQKLFLLEVMLLCSHKATELGAYLLSRSCLLPTCLESATTLINVLVTLQVWHRVHDARWYLGNAVPFPNVWLRLTDVLRRRRGYGRVCGRGCPHVAQQYRPPLGSLFI